MCRVEMRTTTQVEPAPPPTMSRSKRRRRRRSVSFGTVSVREHERIAGDNPAVPQGPSLGLGWGFVEKEALSVKRYEESRDRASALMPLTAETRKFLLTFVFDISDEDMERSARAVKRVQKQRKQTRAKMNIRRKKLSRALPQEDRKEQEDTPAKKVQPKKEPLVIVEDPLPRQRSKPVSLSFMKLATRRILRQ